MDFLYLNPSRLDGQIGQEFIFFSIMSNRNAASTFFCLAFCVCVVRQSGMWYNSRKRLLYGDFSGRPTAMADDTISALLLWYHKKTDDQ